MIDLILVFISSIIFVRGLTTLIFLFQSLKWLSQKSKTGIISKNSFSNKVYLVIPVLREQDRIIETLDYIRKNVLKRNMEILVVTTQKEFEKKFTGPSTYELVKKYIKNNNLSKLIKLIDYPDKNSCMAHQLNYALKQIDKDVFVSFYNADSRPDPETFDEFYQAKEKSPKAEVFQQSAIFTKNFANLNLFLKASAILQSRWTLTHELPRLFRQSGDSPSFLKTFANAHCVGHGLIIKAGLLKSLGGFSENCVTEDLFLGFLIRSSGANIYPLPKLELADNPKTIKSLWFQKYVWFWGPMKYLHYLIYVIKNRRTVKIKNNLAPVAFAVQGLISAVAWLVSGPLVTIALISPLITRNYYIAVFAMVSVFLYGPLQYFLTVRSRMINLNILDALIISLSGIPAIVFHSLPPYHSICAELTNKFFGTKICKPKTDD
ncbi:hypothetical protein A2872_04580 [Candidatus Gottesmanbacteria bacterium RIFCSPHIGHO2_01_FULL_42_12]|uniref:Glycosyltransferase 2-like domain-containing protein n=1 Tax=Candidatus Gottesmanbacteria bacterium RIFCSPHIGHO2_01_FULL_42_12 TaxID=1798377 RepID=A0A1F5Z012_9BACT|nr:MAG: hypothetical protein A2872_04580 [Candidatus Gottesmanbacteria bacterium RIFCSPHIGHO2_01_FULL_42_12]